MSRNTTLPLISATLKSGKSWPVTATHYDGPVRTATSLPTAETRIPVSGNSSGNASLSLESAEIILRGGIRAVRNCNALRRRTASRRVKRYAFRGPRVGVTSPAATRTESTLRDTPSKPCSSRICRRLIVNANDWAVAQYAAPSR